MLKLVVTTRRWLLMEHTTSCFTVLNEIRSPLDIELFMKIVGKIENTEIFEFLKLDPGYPFEILKLRSPITRW